MAGFLKVLFRNLLEGPSTDPFPLGETFTPARLRGRAKVDPNLCVGCGVCRHVCAAGAINISQLPDGSGYTITIWQNSCCLCASCRHYCPTKYEPCAHCGTLIRPIPAHLAKRLYAKNPDIDPELIRHLCPKCRQIEDAKRNACLLPPPSQEKPEERVTSAAPTRE